MLQLRLNKMQRLSICNLQIKESGRPFKFPWVDALVHLFKVRKRSKKAVNREVVTRDPSS